MVGVPADRSSPSALVRPTSYPPSDGSTVTLSGHFLWSLCYSSGMDLAVATVDTNLVLSPLCNYTLENGAKCNSPNTIARGYCEKHYRALKRAGAFEDLVPKPSRRSDLVLANVASVKRARKQLLKNMPTYADLHLVASKNAAQKGDAKPIEWAMLHTRTVEPIAEAKGSPASGTTINIGVKVSGADQK